MREEVVAEDDIAANNVYGAMPTDNTNNDCRPWITTGAETRMPFDNAATSVVEVGLELKIFYLR